MTIPSATEVDVSSEETKKNIRTAGWNIGFFRTLTPRTWSCCFLTHAEYVLQDKGMPLHSCCVASSEDLREKTYACGGEAELCRSFPWFFELLCSDLKANAYKIRCWITFWCFFGCYVVEQENGWQIGLGCSCLILILLLTQSWDKLTPFSNLWFPSHPPQAGYCKSFLKRTTGNI